MNTQYAQKLLCKLAVDNEIAKRHQHLLEKVAADQAAVQAKTAAAVDMLVEHDRMHAHQRDMVTEKLASAEGGHVASLELLCDVARHRNADEITTIGNAVGQEKTSSDCHTGAMISNHDETAAGRAFREKLGC
jgi:hypothetical protein